MVDKVGIAIFVPEHVALAAGITTCGETVFHPTERELGELSTQELNFVAQRYVGAAANHVLLMDCATPTWGDVARLVRSELVKSAATERQRREAVEEATAHATAQQEQQLSQWGEENYQAELAQTGPEGRLDYLGHLVARDVQRRVETVSPQVARYTAGSKHFANIKLRRRIDPRPEAVQIKLWTDAAMRHVNLPSAASYDVAVERLDIKSPSKTHLTLTVVTVRVKHPLWPERIFVIQTESLPARLSGID